MYKLDLSLKDKLINHFHDIPALTSKSGLLNSIQTNARWEGFPEWYTYHPFTISIGDGNLRDSFDLLFRLDICKRIINDFVSLNTSVPLQQRTLSFQQTRPSLTSSFSHTAIRTGHYRTYTLLLALQFCEYFLTSPDRPSLSKIYTMNLMFANNFFSITKGIVHFLLCFVY